MSKIEELIRKLCPDGVEYRKITEIATVTIGEFVHKNKQNNNSPYPVYNGGITNTGFYDEYNNDGKKVLISARGANAGYVNKINKKYWAGNSCYTITIEHEEVMSWEFLYYYLKNNQSNILGQQQTGSIPAISKRQIECYKVPIPPIEVQNEIVRILDNFTELESELESELEARKKQYDYYKEKMLKFSKNDSAVDWVKLGTFCKRLKGTAITASKMKEISEKNGSVKIFAGGKTVIQTSETNIPQEDIITVPNIIVQSRGIIDFIYYDKPCSYKREMWSYTTDNKVTLKFIYYYLKNNVEYFRQRGSQMGSMPQISLDVTEKYKIPIPLMEVQEKIVSTLDKFDKLCNDISEGLPSEIEARRKQYEYYRDKLLNFKELKVENEE